jgi:hypothetical protein
MCPRPPAINGSRPTDVGSSTFKKTASFEGRNDSVAKGERIRLDFRFVLTCFVCVRITTDLGERPERWPRCEVANGLRWYERVRS